MAKGRADISNLAIRVFLEKVGYMYDTQRKLDPFTPTSIQWGTVLKFFEGKCCYCNVQLNQDETKDHLIPVNKSALGLHAWGNVVPCCGQCNQRKHGKDWREYLDMIYSDKGKYRKREAVIENFQKYYHYNPNLEIGPISINLYEDVGAMVMTLIELRLKQAEQVFKTSSKLK